MKSIWPNPDGSQSEIRCSHEMKSNFEHQPWKSSCLICVMQSSTFVLMLFFASFLSFAARIANTFSNRWKFILCLILNTPELHVHVNGSICFWVWRIGGKRRMSHKKKLEQQRSNDGINGCSTNIDCVCKRDQFIQYIHIRAGFLVELDEKKKLK